MHINDNDDIDDDMQFSLTTIRRVESNQKKIPMIWNSSQNSFNTQENINKLYRQHLPIYPFLLAIYPFNVIP